MGSNGHSDVLLHISFPLSCNNYRRKQLSTETSRLLLINGMGRQQARKSVMAFLDPTHSIDLINCKSRTGQNIPLLEQEKEHPGILFSYETFGDPEAEPVLYFQSLCVNAFHHMQQAESI